MPSCSFVRSCSLCFSVRASERANERTRKGQTDGRIAWPSVRSMIRQKRANVCRCCSGKVCEPNKWMLAAFSLSPLLFSAFVAASAPAGEDEDWELNEGSKTTTTTTATNKNENKKRKRKERKGDLIERDSRERPSGHLPSHCRSSPRVSQPARFILDHQRRVTFLPDYCY